MDACDPSPPNNTGGPLFSGNSAAAALQCIMLAVGLPQERLLSVIRDRPAFKGCIKAMQDCPMDARESPLTRR